jgi:hypothetical protein
MHIRLKPCVLLLQLTVSDEFKRIYMELHVFTAVKIHIVYPRLRHHVFWWVGSCVTTPISTVEAICVKKVAVI